jgi:hypothetical protein
MLVKPDGATRIILALYVQPNARCNQIVGRHGEALKVKIQAPACEGKANCQVIEFISQLLELSSRQVELISGAKSRHKRLAISGDVKQLLAKLQQLRILD